MTVYAYTGRELRKNFDMATRSMTMFKGKGDGER
jgi:hypothetical protein